ncbi:hypothetical protein Tco_1276338 [Tanacetum coccineum]
MLPNKDDLSEKQCKRKCVAGNVGGSELEEAMLISGKSDFKIRLLQGQWLLIRQAQESGACNWMKKSSRCFLQVGTVVTIVDVVVDDSPEIDLALMWTYFFEADECAAFDSDRDLMRVPLHRHGSWKKAETLAPKPILALTVYPPNTPVKLVPRILPTKSQVKINLYVLTQLFTEFDKTCKTRITPTGITEGERGFEQTKRCYLTEVIPFFKTLKEHFVGVQTALFKEVKEMEEIFDQMNNEVDKNTVDKQCAEIEKKNLLIENENLIVNCLSTQLLYDVEKSRCLDLEADMSKVHDESKLISKLEREYLNLQLKYQHLQESFDNRKRYVRVL